LSVDHLLLEEGGRFLLEDGTDDLLLESSTPGTGWTPVPGAVPPQVCVGSFTTPASGTTGAQTVTGIVDVTGAPFQPKAVVIWGMFDGNPNPGTDQYEADSFGIDDGVTHCGNSIVRQWFVGGPWTGVGMSSLHSITSVHPIFSAGYNTKGYVSSFASGSFTYTLDVNGDGPRVYNFMAIGGAGLSAKVVSPTEGSGAPIYPDGASTYVHTGLGFTPTGAIFVNHTTPGGNEGTYNDANGGNLNIGFCDSLYRQSGMNSGGLDGQTGSMRSLHPGVTFVDNSNALNAIEDGWGSTATNLFQVTSWDADGFTGINLNGGDTAPSIAALVFGGCGTVVGGFDEPTAPSYQSLDVTGMLPSGILLASVGATRPAGESITTNESWAVGGFDGVRSRSFWHGMRTAANGASTAGYGGANWGNNNSIGLADNAGLNTIQQVGTFNVTSLANHAITGNWTMTDGTPRRVMFFAFGTLLAPPAPTGCTSGSFGVDLVTTGGACPVPPAGLG